MKKSLLIFIYWYLVQQRSIYLCASNHKVVLRPTERSHPLNYNKKQFRLFPQAKCCRAWRSNNYFPEYYFKLYPNHDYLQSRWKPYSTEAPKFVSRQIIKYRLKTNWKRWRVVTPTLEPSQKGMTSPTTTLITNSETTSTTELMTKVVSSSTATTTDEPPLLIINSETTSTIESTNELLTTLRAATIDEPPIMLTVVPLTTPIAESMDTPTFKETTVPTTELLTAPTTELTTAPTIELTTVPTTDLTTELTTVPTTVPVNMTTSVLTAVSSTLETFNKTTELRFKPTSKHRAKIVKWNNHPYWATHRQFQRPTTKRPYRIHKMNFP